MKISTHCKKIFFLACILKHGIVFSQTFHTLNTPLGLVNQYINTPSNDTVYCATETKGIFRSLDNGTTWTGLGGNTIGSGCRDICFSSNAVLTAATNGAGIKYWNGTLWIAFNSGLPLTAGVLPAFQSIVSGSNGTYYASAFTETNQGGGIFFYNGSAWTSIKNNLPDSNTMALAIHPSTGILYAGIPNAGVYKYNGSTWAMVNTSLGNLYIHSLKFNINGDLFAGTSGGLYKLNNGSSIWNNISTGLPSKPVLRILFDPSNSNKIYAALGSNVFISGSLQGDVYVSNNNGVSWQSSFTGINTPRVKALTITANATLIAGAQGNFTSTDNGLTWAVANTGFTARAAITRGFGSCIDKYGNLYYGSDFGVYKSVDTGAHWTFFSQGITSPIVSLMSSDALGNVFAGAYANGNIAGGANTNKLFRLANGGTQWVATNLSADDVYLDIDYAPNGDMYVAHGYGAKPPSPYPGSCLAVSHNRGVTWNDLNITTAGKAFTVAVNKRSHIFTGGETNSVHRSNDGGITWINNLGGTFGHTGYRVSKRDEVFINSNPDPSPHYIYYSDSVTNGNAWTNLTTNTFPDLRSFSDMKFDNSNNMYMSSANVQNGVLWGLYKSSPPYGAGMSFTPVTSIGNFTGVRYMFWDSCGHLYLYTTGGGILKSDALLNLPNPGSVCNFTPLPLQLQFFDAAISGNCTLLQWKTASEINVSGFEVQRSADGTTYDASVFIASKQNTGGTVYDFCDSVSFTGVMYYRLKMIDRDGAYHYSPIVHVSKRKETIFSISPNPAQSHMLIQYTGPLPASVDFTDVEGRKVRVIKINEKSTRVSLNNIPAGIYSVSVSDWDKKLTSSLRIIIE